jgi:hypothetical protein
MKKFLVLYKTPVTVLDGWKDTPAAERDAAEKKMQADWHVWMGKYGAHIKETAGAGKTKRVDKSGTKDTRNDIMLYTMVEAESHDAAAKMFEGHPHLGIPESSIEIMEANVLPGMQQ